MKNVILSISLLLVSVCFAQNGIPTGKWRTHFTYKDAVFCEATNNYVYASTDQGFWRTTNTGEMTKLLRTDGFHGGEISQLCFNQASNTLFIGYLDGSIDLLINDNKIVNIPGFYSKFLQGDKRINHVTFNNREALVSTNFGLLIIDLDKKEIKDSYTSIGNGGAAIRVLSSCIKKDSIYISTVDGILAAAYSNTVNLNDFNQWHYVYSGIDCYQLTAFTDSVFFETEFNIKIYSKGKITTFDTNRVNTARIFNNQFGLHIVRKGKITTLNNAGKTYENINLVVGATQFKDGIYWFCTGIGPGVIKKDPVMDYSFMPNGPSNTSIFKMTKDGDQILCAGGGLSNTFGNAYNNSGFYIYNQERSWKSNITSPLNSNMYDFTFVCHRKANNTYFAATHTNGILIIKGEEIIGKWDESNTPLERNPGDNFIKIGGIAEDSKRNLWIVNYGASNPLLCVTPSGKWYKFDFNSTTDIKGISIDANNRKWLIVNNGIIVFDEGKLDNNADNKSIFISQNNGLVSGEVLSIECDKNGYVWIGTLQGLNIYTGSTSLFTSPKFDRFIVEQDGSTGYLMGEETIKDILIDGGNRKWFATTNGLFLVDEYGQKVLKHYTYENSPLLSNSLICLGQIDESGEIFIGTDKGIVSYRNDANVASESFGEILVYPNPVPPKYNGQITIEGLANNAEIRIADAQGKLIYQTKANGGKAIWNGYRLDGSRPNSGVFFVFGINQDGSETAMGKFIFIQ